MKTDSFADRVARRIERPLWLARNCVLLLAIIAVILAVALVVLAVALVVLMLVLGGLQLLFTEVPIVAWTLVGLTAGELLWRWSKHRAEQASLKSSTETEEHEPTATEPADDCGHQEDAAAQ